MGVSSFKLAKVGGGYWHVLVQLWLKCVFNAGPYKALSVGRGVCHTWRAEDAAPAQLSGAKA
jgi:hypothetical protein